MTQPPTDGIPGDLVRALAGHYVVERTLGVGGMGSVYLGRDITLDRPVAIKVIAPELTTSAVIRERFLKEARTVARLRHPNIVAVYTAGDADGLLYFVMEYASGESLRAVLDRDGRYDDWRAVLALRDLACALAYAHEHGIVHRDVKPDNILIDHDGNRVLLTDFGVARALTERDAQLTGTGFVLGSPRYMSPEQASGDRELDGRSDVYSLGLIGYEMFAGAPAVGGTGAQAILAKQLLDTPAPLETKSERVPPLLAAAITHALAKDPAQRPTAAEFAATLEDIVALGPERARTALVAPHAKPGAIRAKRPPRRRRMILAAAVAIALIGSLGAIILSRSGVPNGVNPRRSYFVAPFEVQGADPQLAWLREGSVSMLTLHFSQWSDLNVVDYERSLDLIRDAKLEGAARIGLEDARRIARSAGVWTVVMGQVSGVGDSVVVVARLYDVASGNKVNQAQRSAARAADPRPLYDALARDLLDLVGAPSPTQSIASTTTSSVEAYRAYLEGVRALDAWQLARADSLFEVATRADTTFALAYYKRALTQGWRGGVDTTQLALMQHAADYARRLPARERDLIAAYGDLVKALHADQSQIIGGQTDELFASAQHRYDVVAARYPDDAEAWYGLGDAYYHQRPANARVHAHNWSTALRAFGRTLTLDSTFHLAYSHKIDVYRQAANPGGFVLLDGDSLLLVDSDSARRSLGTARIDSARQRARMLAVADARAWVASDAVPQSYLALITAYGNAGNLDSAALAVEEAMRRTTARAAVFPFVLAAAQVAKDPIRAQRTLHDALDSTSAEDLRDRDISDRFWLVLNAGDAATGTGDVAALHRLQNLAAAAQPEMRAKVSGQLAARVWGLAAELAMGVPPARLRPSVDSAIRVVNRLDGTAGEQARYLGIALPYTAYLATNDRTYAETARKWWSPKFSTPPAELDALLALDRGDTTAALAATKAFPSADSIRAAGGFVNGMRWFARGEAFQRLGDRKRALNYYETLDPARLTHNSALDAGVPLAARALLIRAHLYEALGDRAHAEESYARFIELWKGADPMLQGQVSEARDGLARVRGEMPPAPAM
jgi:serine/threonine-protein kinase